MEKEIKIKRDIELQRNLFYQDIYDFIEQGYTFLDQLNYKWFVDNVIQENKECFILGYTYYYFENEFSNKVVFHCSYITNKSCFGIHSFEIIKQKNWFKLPKLEKGKD